MLIYLIIFMVSVFISAFLIASFFKDKNAKIDIFKGVYTGAVSLNIFVLVLFFVIFVFQKNRADELDKKFKTEYIIQLENYSKESKILNQKVDELSKELDRKNAMFDMLIEKEYRIENDYMPYEDRD